jgi:hypothetical protein
MAAIYFAINDLPIIPCQENTIKRLGKILPNYIDSYKKRKYHILKTVNTVGSNNAMIVECLCEALSLGYYKFKQIENKYPNIVITIMATLELAKSLGINLSMLNIDNNIKNTDLLQYILNISLEANDLTYESCHEVLEEEFGIKILDDTQVIKINPDIINAYTNTTFPAIKEFFKRPNARSLLNFLPKQERAYRKYLLNMIKMVSMNYPKRNVNVEPFIEDLWTVITNHARFFDHFINLIEYLQNPIIDMQEFVIKLFRGLPRKTSKVLKILIVRALDKIISEQLSCELRGDTILAFINCIKNRTTIQIMDKFLNNAWDIFLAALIWYHKNYPLENCADEMILLIRLINLYSYGTPIPTYRRDRSLITQTYKNLYQYHNFDTSKISMDDAHREEFNDALGICGRLTKCAVKS